MKHELLFKFFDPDQTLSIAQLLSSAWLSMSETAIRADEAQGHPALAPSRRSACEASRRLTREARTIEAMVACYCHAHHAAGSTLCAGCHELLDYAMRRLDRCQFGADKPTCARCPVHCYQRHWRDQIKTVMRYAGPRMLWRHPILSLHHWLDRFHRQ
jgi:hypothetical protein